MQNGIEALAGVPDEVSHLLSPLFDAVPLHQALGTLVPSEPSSQASAIVAELLKNEILSANEPLIAGLWLYADELEKSHLVSQHIPDSTGSFWHAIMHRREGDFENSKYWYRQVGRHPVLTELKGFDPFHFVDDVHLHHTVNPVELVQKQREEWLALFAFSAKK